MKSNSTELDKKDFKKKFESLYLGNKTDTYLKAMRRDRDMCYAYVFFFCARRLALVFSLYYLKEDYYLECMYVLIMTQMAYILYMITSKPHIDSYYNKLEIFNEILVLLIL